MEELARLSDIEQAAAGDGHLVWAAQGQGGDSLGPGVRAWCHGTALAVASPNPEQDRLVVKGDGADAAVLVRRILEEVGPSYRVLGEAALIDALVRQLPDLAPVHNFFWMEATSPSGAAAAGVRWLNAREEQEATSLFDRFFPDSYAQPGRAGMRRWAGVVGEVDSSVGVKPLAVAADAWSAAGCGFMGGVVTHPAARGRGLARVVCGFVVDALPVIRSEAPGHVSSTVAWGSGATVAAQWLVRVRVAFLSSMLTFVKTCTKSRSPLAV